MKSLILFLLLCLSAAAQPVTRFSSVGATPLSTPGTTYFNSTNMATVASWTPSTPGNLVLQYDDTTLPAGSDNTAQTTWTAVVGTTESGTFTLRTGANGLNNLPVAQFNGTSQSLHNSGASTYNQQWTVGVVFKSSAAIGFQVVWSDQSGSFFETSPTATYKINFGNGPVTFGSADTSWHKMIIVGNGASTTYALDGAAPVTVSSNPGANAIINNMYIGVFDNGSSSPLQGAVAALYAWSAGLSSGNQTSWSTYINGKYGI